MIRWLGSEGEGRFHGRVFRNDEGSDELVVYANSDSADYAECAEMCVEALNNLSESAIDEICEGLIRCAKEGGGLDEDFELPALDDLRGLFNYWWFVALYVDMGSKEDEIAYAVEGEGEWGENVGFYIDGNHVVYVGCDYLDHMKNG